MEACFLSLPIPPWHLLLLSEVLPTLLTVILAQMCSRNAPESPECSCLIPVPCSFSGSFSNLTLPSEAVLCFLHLQLTCQLCSLPALIPWPCTELCQGELQVPFWDPLPLFPSYIQRCLYTLTWRGFVQIIVNIGKCMKCLIREKY